MEIKEIIEKKNPESKEQVMIGIFIVKIVELEKNVKKIIIV